MLVRLFQRVREAVVNVVLFGLVLIGLACIAVVIGSGRDTEY